MRKLCLILFLFCAVTCYSQTFYSPVICKLTLRVDDGVRFWGIPGTGSMVTIDADGFLSRGYAGAATVTGLVPTEVLFGKSDGTIDQDANYYYDESTNFLTIGDPTDVTGLTPAKILVANGIDQSRVNPDNIYVGNGALGTMTIDGGVLEFADLGGDLFSIGRVPWSTDMNLLFPSAKGTANQILKVGSVAGDDVNLVWAADATGTVTSFSFTDAHGFDGTVTNATTTPALELITTVTDNQIMYSTGGDITGSPLFTWDDATNNELFAATVLDFTVKGTTDYPSGLFSVQDLNGVSYLGDYLIDVNGTYIQVDDAAEEIYLKADGGVAILNLAGSDNLTYTNTVGTLKAVTLTANDFNFSAPTLSIDYANGQSASTSTKGFLTDTDWDTFNDKTGRIGTPVSLTGQTAAIGATTAYTLPASDGYYRVSFTLTLTTAATSSSQIGFQCRYTNATDNVVKTSPNINDVTRTSGNSKAVAVTYTYFVHAKASTNIQYIANYSSTGATAAVYDLSVVVEKVN